MNDPEARPTNPHREHDELDLQGLERTSRRFGERISEGITRALVEQHDIDRLTARLISHVLGRAHGRASHLARFAREGDGQHEDLRKEYLQLIDREDVSPEAKELVCWLASHLIEEERKSGGLDQREPARQGDLDGIA
ncbi:MAG TPA: hypothetical protein VNT53_00705 [Pseudolysinimonas sp.]|nr:hypothetical protein [Pseudolysinimonas sp.]